MGWWEAGNEPIWAGGVCVPQELPDDFPGGFPAWRRQWGWAGAPERESESGQICPVGSGTVRPRMEGRIAQDGPEGPEREPWVRALCRGGRWLHTAGAAPTLSAESSGGSAPRGPAVVL